MLPVRTAVRARNDGADERCRPARPAGEATICASSSGAMRPRCPAGGGAPTVRITRRGCEDPSQIRSRAGSSGRRSTASRRSLSRSDLIDASAMAGGRQIGPCDCSAQIDAATGALIALVHDRRQLRVGEQHRMSAGLRHQSRTESTSWERTLSKRPRSCLRQLDLRDRSVQRVRSPALRRAIRTSPYRTEQAPTGRVALDPRRRTRSRIGRTPGVTTPTTPGVRSSFECSTRLTRGGSRSRPASRQPRNP